MACCPERGQSLGHSRAGLMHLPWSFPWVLSGHFCESEAGLASQLGRAGPGLHVCSSDLPTARVVVRSDGAQG